MILFFLRQLNLQQGILSPNVEQVQCLDGISNRGPEEGSPFDI